jgi:hypothetical protein
MENSSIVLFIKFFEGCIISKRMKKAKNWLRFVTFLLFVIFCGMFTNVTIGIDGKNVADSTVICMTILYGALILMTMYFQESVISNLLFSNEYFLMKVIKEYLGKIFRDFYLSDVDDYKVTKHIHTVSYYIANLYDLQRIKSQNSILFSNKKAILACKEFVYFIDNKLNLKNKNNFLSFTSDDLYSEQIADLIFTVFNTEYEISKSITSGDSEINTEINAFLNSKFGRKFIDDNVIYASNTFDDYKYDECVLYNKQNLPVIEHTPHYRRHIKDNNKEYYNKKHEKLTESKKKKNDNEKSYLSWMDKI